MMRRSVRTLLLATLLSLVSSFINHFIRHLAIPSKNAYSVQHMSKAEWAADDEGPASFKDISSQRKLNATFINNLDLAIGSLITKSAMYTVSYYMLEFRDEVNEKWMMGFSEYKEKGFPDGLWTNYIEKMIVLDKQKVEVLMKATRASLRSRRIPEGANVMMQYFHDLEPRKIANQIITVREDVSGEVIQDLGSVRLENEEAIRYATTWAREGLASAERSRRMTRMTEESESTPCRNSNYVNFDVMITSLALQLVRDDLVRSKDDCAIQILDDLMIKLEVDDNSRSALERVLHDTHGPRSFMEQLYYRGIIDGVTRNNGKVVNMLKVAENLFDARISIAKESAKLLSLQSLQNRQYYKMIKDYGGFQKLDMSSTPKMKFIDLDARAIDEAKEDAEEQLEKTKAAAAAATMARIAENANSAFLATEVEKSSDSEAGYSNSSGPMMM